MTHDRQKFLSTAFAVALVLLLLPACTPTRADEADKSGSPLPATLLGTWRVTKVLVDTGATRHFYVEYDDPDLMGRILFMSSGSFLSTISGMGDCIDPRVRINPTTAGALIKATMGERHDPPEIPTPMDYELPYAENDPVEAIWVVTCGKGSIGGWDAAIGHGTWMLVLPDGKLAIRWADASVIVLSRVPGKIAPIASFDCKKAKTPLEKTICGSMELALMDRRNAGSYKGLVLTLEGKAEGARQDGLLHPEKFTRAADDLKIAHKAWLTRRSTCQADAACLKKSMLEFWDVLDRTEIPEYYPDTK